MSEHRLKIGITQGDPNGIGWEVILKALGDPRMTELFTPVVYGSPKAAAFYRWPKKSPGPRSFKSSSAMRNPSHSSRLPRPPKPAAGRSIS